MKEADVVKLEEQVHQLSKELTAKEKQLQLTQEDKNRLCERVNIAETKCQTQQDEMNALNSQLAEVTPTHYDCHAPFSLSFPCRKQPTEMS